MIDNVMIISWMDENFEILGENGGVALTLGVRLPTLGGESF